MGPSLPTLIDSWSGSAAMRPTVTCPLAAILFVCIESHFKDNPALSMLNDSDDEVIYG